MKCFTVNILNKLSQSITKLNQCVGILQPPSIFADMKYHTHSPKKVKIFQSLLTNTVCPFWLTTRGPPESPPHMPTKPTPLVQRVLCITWLDPNTPWHCCTVMTSRLTWFLSVDIDTPICWSLVLPYPTAIAHCPANESCNWLTLGKAAGWMDSKIGKYLGLNY